MEAAARFPHGELARLAWASSSAVAFMPLMSALARGCGALASLLKRMLLSSAMPMFSSTVNCGSSRCEFTL